MDTGLFFGSFNPVHVGHLIIANSIVEQTHLDEVWFVVSPQNPFKNKASLLNEFDRLHLLELAIGENSKLKASSIEFKLPQPSYTVDTLAYLYDKFPKRKFHLIMGSDNLQNFHKWKNFEQILKHHRIYVYKREGFDGGEMKDNQKVNILDVPLLNISATYLRKCIKEEESVQYMIPEKAYQYILEMSLYK